MTDIEHGTYGGYQKHKRIGVELCKPCRDANNEYHRSLTKRVTPGQVRAKIRQQSRVEAAVIVAKRYAAEFEQEIANRLDFHGYDQIEARRGRRPLQSAEVSDQ